MNRIARKRGGSSISKSLGSFRGLTGATAALGIAAAATIAFSAPAHAANPNDGRPEGAVCSDKIDGDGAPAVACFLPKGDKVYINDKEKDGLRAVAQVWSDEVSGGPWECHDKNGSNNGWTVCNFNFPEGKWISISAVLRKGACGPQQGCNNKWGSWVNGTRS
ncbi:hypothetical protein [Streptomyces sp. NRRL S-920]|uniref:hypothetical protein n=1 Tax=Streptomyces sp. NRRL S-920 TaxID=1463921 RepID=UPI00131DE515|nr:hypothetical protein [Streptomyces sp. NRRL S-920]